MYREQDDQVIGSAQISWNNVAEKLMSFRKFEYARQM